MLSRSSSFSNLIIMVVMKNRKTNFFDRLFRRGTKKIRYANCLTHRTWLGRQVQEELLKQEYLRTVTGEDPNWYNKYMD